MMIGLQGLANRDAPVLYLTYPEGWDISYTSTVRDYLRSSRPLKLQELEGPIDALRTIISNAKALNLSISGYVVWDTEVRESLVVAYTIAGVRDALVISKHQLPLMEQFGLKEVENLNKMFRGKSPAEIYGWAKQKYFAACNRTVIVWAGGECNTKMKPGVMDYGVSNRAFFTDLDTRTQNTEEYNMANGLLEEMEGDFMMMGWHSYCKDFEHTFTTLASANGGRVHGLNTNPNLSFMTRISLPSNFTFQNRHSNLDSIPSANVYITLVQTDGLGLGAWDKPGRGKLPYAWEVMMPDLDIQPALLQMFYEQASENDFFVAALSGPGYVYPKAIPSKILPSRLLAMERSMNILDLHHLVIFDASAAVGEHTVTEDTTLSEPVVKEYFRLNRTSIQGFLNGYGPTFTNVFDNATQRALLSFDYYLDPERSIQDAASDIQLLARLNPREPYLLAMHVREWSTVEKVEQIISMLDPEVYKVVPIDQFFTIANSNPTFMNRYT